MIHSHELTIDVYDAFAYCSQIENDLIEKYGEGSAEYKTFRHGSCYLRLSLLDNNIDEENGRIHTPNLFPEDVDLYFSLREEISITHPKINGKYKKSLN